MPSNYRYPHYLRPVPRRLMGAIPQQLPGIGGGSSFQFGYNPGVISGTFGNKIYDPSEIAGVLEDAALSYDTRSYVDSGWLNPYIVVTGYAVTTWSSGSDFGQEIYNAIAGAGYPIDYGSIQFRFEPLSGQPAPPPMVGTPYPNTGSNATNPNAPAPPPGQCDFSKMSLTNYLACQLGVTPSSAATIGVVGTLGVVLLIALAVKR